MPKRKFTPKKSHTFRAAHAASSRVAAHTPAENLEQAGASAYKEVLKQTGNHKAAVAAMEGVAKAAKPKARRLSGKTRGKSKTRATMTVSQRAYHRVINAGGTKGEALKAARAASARSGGAKKAKKAPVKQCTPARTAKKTSRKKAAKKGARRSTGPLTASQRAYRRVIARGGSQGEALQASRRAGSKKTSRKKAAVKKTVRSVTVRTTKKTVSKPAKKRAAPEKKVNVANIIARSKGRKAADTVIKRKSSSGKKVAKKPIKRLQKGEALLGPEKLITVSEIVRRARTNKMRVWMCSGRTRTGCGGGKSGGHVAGHLV